MRNMLIFNCKKDNDLFQVFKNQNFVCKRFDNFLDAIHEAPADTGILVLADDYPIPNLNIDSDLIKLATKKHLRLYIEYPLTIPNLEFGSPCTIKFERGVISSDFFDPDLPRLSILSINGCWFMPVNVNHSHIVLARVAGYDKAVFGLPEKTFPVLFEYQGYNILIATTKLSQFVTARYAPKQAWKVLWGKLLAWLMQNNETFEFSWSSVVDVSYSRDESLSKDVELKAFKRSVRWFQNMLSNIDEHKCILEGYQSNIDYIGRQLLRPILRGDCNAEASMVFAYDWKLTGNPHCKNIAEHLLDYVWSSSAFHQNDKNSPAYGLNNWYEHTPIFYGDDNARVILPTLLVSRLFETDKWDIPMIRCLLANLRTTGPLGFRSNRIDFSDMLKDNRGWQYYYNTEVISYAPHYQAYLWACYLWAYILTGYEDFFLKVKNAIRMTMNVYPKWRWTNGLTQEMSRMLLPLAWLVRIEDTLNNRKWFSCIAEDLIAEQQECGAIRERIGEIKDGQYPSSQSNEAYGKGEASIIQQNGDPACDLLYTANFAFLGFHEASIIGDKYIQSAENKLAEFLCRIQIHSENHPYLDGCWMRSFDYRYWEYWGSGSDVGWGPYSVEAGWTNAWISAIFAMRKLRETLFDTSISKRIKKEFHIMLQDMEMKKY